MLTDLQCPYLHGPISRAAAEGHLRRFGLQDGHFLVRRKELGTFVLCVCVRGRVEHHLIAVPKYTIGPFVGPFSCLYDLVQAMRLPTSGWHVPLTTPCTRKLVATGSDPVGLAEWQNSSPSLPCPDGGWPDEHVNSGPTYDVASGPPAHAVGVGHDYAVRPDSLHFEAGGLSFTGSGEVVNDPLYESQSAVAMASYSCSIDRSTQHQEPLYDTHSDAAIRHVQSKPPTRIASGAAVATSADAHMHDTRPVVPLTVERGSPPSGQTGSAEVTPEHLQGLREEIQRKCEVRRGFEPPPLPTSESQPSDEEPSYAEVEPDGQDPKTVAPSAMPSEFISLGNSQETTPTVDAQPRGVTSGPTRKSRIGRLFSRKSKRPPNNIPSVTITSLDNEATTTTECIFYGSTAVPHPCGAQSVEAALDGLFYVSYANSSRVPNAIMSISPQRAVIRDSGGELLSETPLYSVAYVYTDPEAEPQLLAFIHAGIHTDDRFLCTVVESAAGLGVDLKRKIDAALTVANLPIQYDGPDTFASNGYK